MAKIYGQLEKAQLENLASEPASAPLGYVYHDTATDCAKVKTSDGFKKVLGVSGSAKILTTSSVPSSAGLAAPIGSLAMHEGTGQIFAKTGAGNTAWSELSSLADGSITTAKLANGAVTPAKLSSSNFVQSASSGNFFTNTNAEVQVTNFSINITTSGRPVVLQIIPDGSTTSASYYSISSTFGGGVTITSLYRFKRGGSTISYGQDYFAAVTGATEITDSVSRFQFIDTPTAGTHTYTFTIHNFGGGAGKNIYLVQAKLTAREI